MAWSSVLPKELIDEPAVTISGDETVEKACEILVSSGASCLLVESSGSDLPQAQYDGLFDYADVNVFLLVAIGAYSPLHLEDSETERFDAIVRAAKSGGDVFVRDACNLSERNPLVFLSADCSFYSLLEVFSRGTHRIAIKDTNGAFLGIIADRRLVRWFADHAPMYPELTSTLQIPLRDMDIGASKPVVSLFSDATVLDAMKMMNDHGVSSVAVMDASRSLLSAVSVTDIGKLVATSEERSVLSVPLSQFISLIKLPYGSTDGEDKSPIYSVAPRSTFGHAIQLLLATNSHRVFISPSRSPTPSSTSSPILSASIGVTPSPSPSSVFTPDSPSSSASGVVSVVDVLSVFARLAGVSDVDPNSIRKLRRVSSPASTSVSSSSSAQHVPVSFPIPGTGICEGMYSPGSMSPRSLHHRSLSSSVSSEWLANVRQQASDGTRE